MKEKKKEKHNRKKERMYNTRVIVILVPSMRKTDGNCG